MPIFQHPVLSTSVVIVQLVINSSTFSWEGRKHTLRYSPWITPDIYSALFFYENFAIIILHWSNNLATDMYKRSLIAFFSQSFRGSRSFVQPHQNPPFDLCSELPDQLLVSANEADINCSMLIIESSAFRHRPFCWNDAFSTSRLPPYFQAP